MKYEHMKAQRFIDGHLIRIDELEDYLESNFKSLWDFIESSDEYRDVFSDITHDYCLKHSVSDLDNE